MQPDIGRAKLEIERHLRAEEGERLKPYLCQAGKPTIGVGATTYEDGRPVSLSDPPITRERSASMLSASIDGAIRHVLDLVNGVCTTNQLIALVCCGYNIGWGVKGKKEGLAGSSMVKFHVAGDYAAAARAFRLWNKYTPPGGPKQVHPVLDARRAREAAIYLTPDEGFAGGSPQAVEPEKPLVKSVNVQAGTVAAGAGVVAVISEAAGTVQGLEGALRGVKTVITDVLGVPTEWLLPIVLVTIGWVVIRDRLQRRKEGWT